MTNTKLKLSKLLDLFSAELYWWLYCKQAVTLAVMSNIFNVKCNLYIQWLALLEVDCAADIFIYFISGIWLFKTFSYLPTFLNSCMNFCHKLVSAYYPRFFCWKKQQSCAWYHYICVQERCSFQVKVSLLGDTPVDSRITSWDFF